MRSEQEILEAIEAYAFVCFGNPDSTSEQRQLAGMVAAALCWALGKPGESSEIIASTVARYSQLKRDAQQMVDAARNN